MERAILALDGPYLDGQVRQDRGGWFSHPWTAPPRHGGAAATARYRPPPSHLASGSLEHELLQELAQLAVEREEEQLLRTIAVLRGTAVANVAEIHDIRRFPAQGELAPCRGRVPWADSSERSTGGHRRVEPGKLARKRFHRRKAERTGPMRVRTAVARNL
jgi:hypothetical protein